MIMAQQYFKTRPNVNPVLVARANDKIERSYKRLLTFECDSGGFEWFGRGDGHESLTAFGIMQFQDMAKVFPVEQELLDRTRKWLDSRRNDDGGFHMNPRFLHSWGVPQYVADAYIVWSLTESGTADLAQQIERLFKDAMERDDPYYNSLVALSLFNTGRDDDARRLLERMVKHQQDDGSVTNARTTVVNSRGNALVIETSAVAVLAWLKDGRYAGNVERTIQWLVSRSEDGRFGSTQSTVLALKAIMAYEDARSTPERDGQVVVLVNGVEFATVPFTKDTLGGIDLPDFASQLTPGTHRIELRMIDGAPMPWSVDVEFFSLQPENHPDCPLELEVALSDRELTEGESTEVNVVVRNLDAESGQGLSMAIVGLPGGLEPRHERLRELRDAGIIDSYEVIGRDVVFYFTMLMPGQEIAFSFDTIAAVPGQYTGQASRTYLYYGDEYRMWVEGLQVTINPR
jgi:alpha-2-macroglobulin-like protein